MKKGFFFTLTAILASFSGAFAQVAIGAVAVTPGIDSKDPVLMTIGTTPVFLSEFNYVYKKNNKDTTHSPQAVESYLDLFTTFKRKVREAEELKMDTSSAFKNELGGYRRQVSLQYLTDRQVNDSLLMEAYNRMNLDVRASHILVLCDENALPRDTDIAYTRVNILQNLLTGKPTTKVITEYESKLKTKWAITKKSPAADTMKVFNMVNPLRQLERRFKNKPASFDEVAFVASEDLSARQNRGDLGYFTAFSMVYNFETLAYNTPVGKVGGPCKTKYGYHLINVIDKRPASGKILVSHIMIKSPTGAPTADSIAAKAKVDEIYAKVQAGEDFATLARQFSDDKQSAVKGGEIPMFGLYEMPQTFEKAAFGLANNGEVAAPIKTAWGWHIIKRIEKKEIPAFEVVKPEIKQRVNRDQRGNQGKVSLIARVKKENGFTETPATVKEFYKVVDSTYYMGRWSAAKAAGMNKTMFVLAGKNYTQQDFAIWLELHQVRGVKQDIPVTVDAAYKNWIDESCVVFEDSQLERKYPDFKNLMQEYRDGMLLFDLMDKKVWSKAVKDTTGLRTFYEANKTKYMLPERADATVFSCKDEATAKKVRKMLKEKKTTKEILDSCNKDSKLNVTADHKMWVKGENGIVDRNWKKGLSKKNEVKDNRFLFVSVNMIDPVRPKTLQEARGAVTTDYQNQLDKEWVESLKKKYPVVVNRDVLKLVK